MCAGNARDRESQRRTNDNYHDVNPTMAAHRASSHPRFGAYGLVGSLGLLACMPAEPRRPFIDRVPTSMRRVGAATLGRVRSGVAPRHGVGANLLRLGTKCVPPAHCGECTRRAICCFLMARLVAPWVRHRWDCGHQGTNWGERASTGRETCLRDLCLWLSVMTGQTQVNFQSTQFVAFERPIPSTRRAATTRSKSSTMHGAT